jgi:hypothetical protein
MSMQLLAEREEPWNVRRPEQVTCRVLTRFSTQPLLLSLKRRFAPLCVATR